MDSNLRLKLATRIASKLTDELYYRGSIEQHQANYLFDKLVDVLIVETDDQLLLDFVYTGARAHVE